MNDNINMNSTIAGPMNNNIKQYNSINSTMNAESMNDNINIDNINSTIAESMNDNSTIANDKQYNDNINRVNEMTT